MGLISNLVGIDSILNNVFDIIKRVIPDKTTQEQLQHEIELYRLTSDFQNSMAQIEVNKVEASSTDRFVSGWRPFIGWVCGAAFVYHVLLVPFVGFISGIFGHQIPLPVFDHELLSNVLYGMLGLGGFRTAEKIYKVHSNTKERILANKYGPGSSTYTGK